MVKTRGVSPRFKVDIPLRFRERGSMEWNDGQVMNLSSGGLCFESIEFVKPGKDLEIMIETKDRRGQHHCRLVRAAVVWKSGPRCGVAFAKAAGAIKIK